MKKNVFTKLNFTVSGFCGSKRRRRFIALLSLFGMLIGSTASAIVIPPFSGEVLPEVNGNGGAFITGTTEYIKVEPAGAGNNASISLVNGFNAGLINWSALSIGQGQSISFIGDKFFNVVEGTKASEIAGTLNANGSVWIFNPAGISFIDGAQVNVGGLFSAVAAGLANKDEMAVAIDNTGTVMDDPVLDNTVVGKIAVENGVVFGGAEYDNGAWTTTDKVGNGVVLAGKSVTVEDGVKFNANNVTLAAGGKLVIDNVNEGKVTFKITDFADNVDDVFVSFQDTDSSDATDVTTKGDLEVFTEGSVNVNETVKADGNIYISGAQEPSGSAPVIGVKQMTVASGKLIQGKSVSAFSAGKISADGDITAKDGDITLEAIEAIELYGDVTASSDVNFGGALTQGAGTIKADTLKLGGDSSVAGKIVVSENIDAGSANLTVKSGADVYADLTITAGKLEVADGKVDAWKIESSKVDIAGGEVSVDVSITGDVTVDGAASSLKTPLIDGRLTQENGTVGDGAADLEITGGLDQNGGTLNAGELKLGADSTVAGIVNSKISADGQSLTVKSGADITTGFIGAETLKIDGGDIDATTIVGDSIVQSAGEVVAANVSGDIEQTGGKMDVSGDINGDVIQSAAGDDASISAQNINNSLVQQTGNKGTVTVGWVASVEQHGGKIAAKNDTLEINGTLTQTGGAIGDVNDVVTIGGAFAQGGGRLSAKTLNLKADSEVAGTVEVDESVVAEMAGATKTLTVNGGSVGAAAIKANIEQTGGAITVADTITGDVTVDGGASTLKAAKVDGDLTQENGVIGAVDKNLEITGTLDQDAGTIEAATLKLGQNSYVAGDVNAGEIDATGIYLTQNGNGTVTVTGANGITASALKQEAEGVVKTDKVSGNVQQTSSAKLVSNGGASLEVTGDVYQSDTAVGAVIGTTSEDVTIGKDFTQRSGTVNAETLTLKGDVSQNGGKVVAKSLVLDTAASASLASGNNDFDTVKGTAKSLNLKDADDVELLDVSATDGDVDVVAEGAITVSGAVSAGDVSYDDTYRVATWGATAKGNVNINADSVTVANGSKLLAAGDVKVTSTGDSALTVDGGIVMAENGITLKAETGAGDVDIKNGAYIVSDSKAGGSSLTVSSAKGNVIVSGADTVVYGKNEVKISAGTGKTISIGEGSAVDAEKMITLLSDTFVAGELATEESVPDSRIDAYGVKITVNGDSANVGANVINADTLDIDKGLVQGREIVAAVVQDGGTVTVADKVTGDVTQNGGSLSVANEIAGNVTQVKGEIATAKIDGTLDQSADGKLTVAEVTGAATVAGTVNGDGGLTFGSTLNQTAGTIDAKGDLTVASTADIAGTVDAADAEIGGKLTQTAGALNADVLTLKGGAEISAKVAVDSVDADGQTVLAKTGADVDVTGDIKAGTLDVDGGTVDAATVTAAVVQDGGTVTVADKVTGNVTQNGGALSVANEIAGNVTQVKGEIATAKIDGTLDQSADGKLTVAEVTGAATVAGTVNGDGGLAFGSTLNQTAGAIDAKGYLKVVSTADIAGNVDAADAEIGGKLTQMAGELNADVLTLKGGAEISANVAVDSVDADGQTVLAKTGADVDVAGDIKAGTLDVDGGTVDAATVAANVVQDGGTVTVADKVTGDVTQNGGALSAKDVEGATFKQTGGDATVAGTLTAVVDQDAGTLSADAVVGNVDQDGGTMAVATTVTGDVAQNGSGSVTAAKIDGNVTQETGNGGTVTTSEITKDLVQNGGKVVAKDDTLTVGGATTQNGGEIGDDNDAITFNGKLMQTAGELNADTLNLDGTDNSVAGSVNAKTLDADGQTLTVTGNVDVEGDLKAGTLDVDAGTVEAATVTADVVQDGGTVTVTDKVTGDVTQNGGALSAKDVEGATFKQTGGDATVAGTLTAVVDQDAGTLSADAVVGNVDQDGGTMAVATTVTGDVAQNGSGSVTAAKIDGNVTQETGNGGTVTTSEITKDLVQNGGKVVAKDDTLTVGGATTQNGGEIGDDNDAITFNGKLMQTAGELNADTLNLDGTDNSVAGSVNAKTLDADGQTLTVTGNVDVEGDLKAGTLDVDAGTVEAATVTADVVQDGGTVTVTDKVTGDVTQNGGVLSAANEIAGNVTQVNGEIATAKVSGTLNQTAGTLTTKEVTGAATVAGTVNGDGGLTFGSTLNQTAGTLTADGDLKVASTADIAGNVDAADAEIGGKFTQTGGELKADALTLKAGAEISGTVTAGSVDADGQTVLAKTGADVDVAGDIKAGTLDVDGGTVDAATVAANVVQDGGTMTVADTVTGDVTQNKGEISAAKIDGTLTQSADGVLTTKEVTGAATVAGTVNGVGGLKFGSTLKQTAGTIDAKGNLTVTSTADIAGTVKASDAEIGGKLTQTAGELDANTLTLNGGAEQTGGKVIATSLVLNNSADVSLASADNDFNTVQGTAANLTVNDTDDLDLLDTSATSGDLKVTAGGEITVDGVVDATGGVLAQGGSVTVNAGKSVSADGNIRIEATDATGKVELNGSVEGANVSVLALNGGSVSQNATITATAADGFVDVEAGGALDMAAGTTTEAKTIVYQGTGGTVSGKFEGNVSIAGIGVGGGAEMAGDKVVMDVSSLGSSGNAVKLNASEISINATGDIYVKNSKAVTVKAHAGAAGVTVNRVQEDLSVANEGTVATSDIEGIISQNGNVSLVNEGNVIIESGAGVIAKGGTVDVDASGDVTVAGEVWGKTGVTVDGANVMVNGGTVKAGKFSVDMATGVMDVDTVGNLTLEAGNKVEIKSGAQVGASGDATVTADGVDGISVDGSYLVANESLAVTAKNGDVTVLRNAYVGANAKNEGDKVSVTAENGKVVIEDGATVASRRDVDITAAKDIVVDGNATKVGADAAVKLTTTTVDGSIKITGASVLGVESVVIDSKNAVTVGGAKVLAGKHGTDATTGEPKFYYSGKDLKVTAKKGVTIENDSAVGASGKVEIDGGTSVSVSGSLVKAGEYKNLDMTTGELDVDHEGDLTLTADKIDVNGKANVIATGTVDVDAKAGGVTVTGADTKLAANGAMNIDAEGGAVKVSGKAFVGGNSTVFVGAAGNTASAEIDGATLAAKDALDVTAKDSVLVTGADAKVASDKALTLKATESAGTVTVESGAEAHGKTGVAFEANDITVDNALVKAGKFSVDASGNVTSESDGNLTMTAGNKVEIKGGAQVGASGTVDIDAEAGGVTVTGDNTKLAANGEMNIDAADGAVKVSGKAFVGGNSTVFVGVAGSTDSVEVNGATLAAKDAFEVTAKNSVLVSGADAKVASDDNVKLAAIGTDGVVTVESGAKVLSEKAVDIDATVDVTVASTVRAKGSDDGAVKALDIQAGNKVEVSGTVEATAGTVAMNADGTDDGDGVKVTGSVTGAKGVAVTADGEVTVEGGLVKAGKFAWDGSSVPTVAADDSAALTVTAGKGVTLQNNAMVGASGEATVTANDGNVTVTASKLAANKALKVTAENTDGLNDDGSISVAGGSFVGGNDTATLTAAKDVTVNASEVAAVGDVSVTATGDKVEVLGTDAKIGSNAKVTLDAGTSVTVGAGAEVLAETAIDIDADDDVTVAGTVRAKGADGTDKALDIQADDNVEVSGTVEATVGSVAINADGTDDGDGVKVTGSVTGANGVAMTADKDVLVDGGTIKATESLKVTAVDGNINLTGGKVLAKDADFTASGDIYADNGANDFTGTVTAKGSKVTLKDAKDGINLGDVSATATDGDVLVETVAGDITVNDGATVQGNVTELSAKQNVKVNGTVSGTDFALLSALDGNVEFDADGTVKGDTVTADAAGDITQAGASVPVDDSGYANDQQVHAAVQATYANLIAGGSIGNAEQGTSDYIGVQAGSVAADAAGDVAIAGGNGSDVNVDCVTAGGDVSLFTTGTVHPNGTVTAGGDLTVSAKDFSGGAVKMNMNDTLTVNNFQTGDKPLIAFFETNGGNRNPEINNQPNETIIFIDGRLAGGDIKTINLLGAIEAFPVQTPELKSEQGVFGNPLFLHDDLDVATPLAVGAIDYLLLELPRMELSSDFPIGVEKQVSANGLNPTTSYWFGQNPAAEDEADDANDDGKGESPTGNEGASPDAGSNPVTAMK